MAASQVRMTLEVIEQHWSADRQRRASVLLRLDGLFLVEVERLVPADHEFDEPEHWSRVGSTVILTDTLEVARQRAADELRQETQDEIASAIHPIRP